MELTIIRGDHKPWGIDGHLYINRKRICDTVEHPTHHLSSGEYHVSLPTKEATEAGFFPFRHGDGALSLRHGEIIVGKQLLPGVVTQSQATYERLYERLRKAAQRGTIIRLKMVG